MFFGINIFFVIFIRFKSITVLQLCKEAQDWANHLAHSDTFAYQNKIDYGQNLLCRRQTDRKSSSDIEG